MLKKILLLSFFCLICIKSFGATQVLIDITGDSKISPEKKITKLYVDVNDSNEVSKISYKRFLTNGNVDEEKEFDPSQYEGSYFVLVNESGRDVVKVWIDSFARHNGGYVKLDYLVSGVSDRRSSLMLELSYNGEQWELLDYETNRPLKSLHFKANTLLGKVIGIKKVQKNY